jgi:hypothetical protein
MRLAEELRLLVDHANGIAAFGLGRVEHVGTEDPRVTRPIAVCAFA